MLNAAIATLLFAALFQSGKPMLAGGEGDPLALAKSTIGMDDTAFKAAAPGKHGVLFDAACPGQITAAHKDGRVVRAILWSRGPGCATLAETALRKHYGEPVAGGYGYATTLGVSRTYHEIGTVKWCQPGLDIILVRMPGQESTYTIFVSKAGSYDPGSGKSIDPNSQAYQDSCGPAR